MKIFSLVFILIILLVFLYEFLQLEIHEGYTNKATGYANLANTGQLSAADNLKATKFGNSSVNYVPNSSSNKLPNIDYNKDPLQVANVQYHPTEEQIIAEQQNDTTTTQVYVLDQNGNTVAMPVPTVSTPENILYYTPGSYPFGPSSYVPNYEDTVFISKLTNKTTAAPVQIDRNTYGGFCEKYKNNPMELDQQCKTVDLDKCASTNCCVLLGGSKCVAGNEHGPAIQSNYGDAFLRNRDFYYYKSKCYGNCSSNETASTGFVTPSNSSSLISISSLANISSAGLSIYSNPQYWGNAAQAQQNIQNIINNN